MSRELALLALVREGRRNHEIAERLHVAEDAAKTRLKNAMTKLCSTHRTHAVTLARQRGLLDDATDVATVR
jgi:DNA-binding NarL/FixJ family response regulator